MTEEAIQRLRERYHVAKLSLFNVRLLYALQTSDHRAVRDLIDKTARENSIATPIKPLHQGAFLSFAYICLVWLWESIKAAGLEAKILDRFKVKIPYKGLPLDKISGPRKIDDWRSVLRLLRNALSHGRVSFDDHYFLFSDKDERTECESTLLKLEWSELGTISETLIHSTTGQIWLGEQA